MNNALSIVDGFLGEHFAEVREFALSHDFTQAPEYDGHRYPGFAPIQNEAFLKWVAGRLANTIGCDVQIHMAAFVAGTEGFDTQQWIHADSGCARVAGVVYLFDRRGYGTQFWQHLDFRADQLSEVVRASESPEDVAHRVSLDGNSEQFWKRTDYADSVQDRLIFYPTDRFHSRWPRQAFGDSPANCRLTMVLFFDILQ